MFRNPEAMVGQCTYCGEVRPLGRDHVPPKNLFSKPLPVNLITVPSCQTCNNGASLNDEYFRLAITPGIDPDAYPVSVEAIQKLRDPRKRGFANYMVSSFRRESIRMPDGQFQLAGSVVIDTERVLKVISRVTRGLYFHHLGRRLPDSFHLGVWPDWLDASDSDVAECLASLQFVPPRGKPISIGNGVFCYSFHTHVDDDPDVTAWRLSFYGKRHFFCFTLPS